ncbi:RNA polymerase sigma factor [Paenibacillus sacheonensis]|uniref:RNA polymerase sigma factor n=1 Tax=Paenibacillus sacheonensis TaxID=742054 RepID=A0A7X4YPG3_9BACL|nr:sigma-70 family RNA polymerase sigma factor [Paenibacillus sacheonensis]NBC70108.1 sigma-70 family RNA polymerase sigma factor [Paenibacillus sacheonensis]
MEDDYLKTITRLDPPEIESLVRHYWHDIWQYAYFLTRREHLAEDIAQDTFIRAFRAVESFRGQCAVKTWLFKIARNTAFNYTKSAFLRKVTLVGLLPDQRRSPSAESAYFSTGFADDIWSAVLRLPRVFREILILHAHEELSYRELAELLGISEGTVKSRLCRARTKLAKLMKEAGRDVETDYG